MHKAAALVVALAALTDAFQAPQTHARTTRRHMLNNGGNFGQVFYMGYRYEPPNGLGAKLPDGVYEVALPKPCGIVLEELDPNFARGVKVLELVEGGNAQKSGAVQPGLLVGVSAVRFVGPFERAVRRDEDGLLHRWSLRRLERVCAAPRLPPVPRGCQSQQRCRPRLRRAGARPHSSRSPSA